MGQIIRNVMVATVVSLALCLLSAGPSFAAQKKVIYFTFDDGPGAVYTPQILNILRQKHVHATFFVLGYRCRALPAIVRRIQREGHEIGSHGYDHADLSHRSFSVVKSEITRADSAIITAVGHKPIYYRPPYGALRQGDTLAIQRLGHKVAYWTVDSQDWKAKSAVGIVQNVERSAHSGSVVLFHDGVNGSRYTVQALPILIDYYRAKGYEFRTL